MAPSGRVPGDASPGRSLRRLLPARVPGVLTVGLGLGFALAVSACEAAVGSPPSGSCVVGRIIDGDTFVCRSGERVRLTLVNTPEMSDEPLGRMAREFVSGLMPPGTEVELELDVAERDRYGRILAYVYLPDGRMVNRILAREGYAQVMVVPPNVRYVDRMRAAVDSARREGAGLWRRSVFGSDGDRGDRCDPAYPGVCIPPPPPDLDCRDVSPRRFEVRAPDPHRFDGDGNGVGCESP